ncbi:MAG: GDSL-type esterase/lipase family protein [Halioglobus sp.]
MSKYLWSTIAIIAVLASWPAYKVYSELGKAQSEDPLVWEEDIEALLKKTSSKPGDVLFMGSSSIRFWDTLARDMAPLGTINRGFGGAKFADAIYYADKLVDVVDPAAIVIFVGTNDIHPGATKPAEVLLNSFRELIAKIRRTHALTPIYYIAITPSTMRWEVWPIAERTNQLIEQFTAQDETLHFIDTGPALLRDGEPNRAFYVLDGLHLNDSGYQTWTDIIRPRLLADLTKN